VGLNFRVFAQVEEVLFESLGAVTEMLADLLRQQALEIDGPLERYDDRDPEIVEQTDKVSGVGLDPGTEPLVDLGQEKALEVDDRTAAAIRCNAFHCWHAVPPGIMVVAIPNSSPQSCYRREPCAPLAQLQTSRDLMHIA
jgi:hypothetical protein